MRILFAGTPDFAVAPLQALHEAHEVVAVFTQPDRRSGRGKKLTPPPVKVAALERNIAIHQPTTLKDQVNVIEALDIDVMVVVAYGMLLPQSVLDLPRIACLNIHASLLPRWRGAAPIQRAIQAGDKITGVSIMRMELGLDTGPVFQTLETAIHSHDTSGSMHDKLAQLGAKGIIETLSKLEEDPALPATQQDDDQANYAHKITKDEANIEWTLSAAEIDQRVRAFNPWPICQTYYRSERVRVWQARVSTQTSSALPGAIVEVSEDAIVVACGQGCLELQVLQRAGSKPLAIREFKNGFALALDDRFSAEPTSV